MAYTEAQKRASASYYQRNKSDYKRRARESRARLVEWYQALKSRPCIDCKGSFHHAAMQFDHLPGTEKLHNVADMISSCKSKADILTEIAKCELVCANCHAVRGHERRARESSLPR